MHILIHTKIKIMYSFNKISSKLTRCFNTYKEFPQQYYLKKIYIEFINSKIKLRDYVIQLYQKAK